MPTRLTIVAFAGCLLQWPLASAQKLDNYGDALPSGAVLRLGSTRLAASGGFTWLPDGKTLVTAKHGKLLFWDVTSGILTKELTTPMVAPDGVNFRYGLDCSADGKRLVCAGHTGQFCVCDLATDKFVLSPLPGPNDRTRLETVAINPQGTVIASVDGNGHLRMWDAANCGVHKIVAVGRNDETIAPAFSADGNLIAVAAFGRGKVLLAPVESGQPPYEIAQAHHLRVHSLNFTSDGGRLITTGTGEPTDTENPEVGPSQIRIWDLATKKMIRDLPLPPGLTGGCLAALAADDKLLVSLHGDRILIWDLASDRPPRALEARRFPPSRTKLRIDPRGKYVAAAHRSEGYAEVIDLATGKPPFSPERHVSFITSAAFSKDGRTIATGGADRAVRMWNAQTGEHLRTINKSKGWIRGLAFHDDDRRLLVSSETTVPGMTEYRGALSGFNTATGETLFETELPERGAALSVSPTGTLLAVASRNLDDGAGAVKLRLFDPFSGKKTTDVPGVGFGGFEDSIPDFQWSADGKSLLAACEDNTMRRINLNTGEILEQIAVPHLTINRHGEPISASVQCAAFLGAERVVTASMMSGDLICWDLATGAKLWTVHPPQTSVRKLAASPDRKLLACTSTIGREPFYTHLSLWEVATQKQLADVELGQEDVYAMTFSPDGKRLLLGFTAGNALVYEVAELK